MNTHKKTKPARPRRQPPIEARQDSTRPADLADQPPALESPPAALLPAPTEHGKAVEQLLRWIAKGASPLEQAEALAKHFPGVSAEAVYRDALAQITSLADPHPTLTRGFCFLAAQELHRRAVESGDISAALRALRFLANLAANASPATTGPAPA